MLVAKAGQSCGRGRTIGNVIKPGKLALKLTVGMLIICSCGFLQGQDAWNFPDFSAIQLLATAKQPMPMKVYLSGSNVRVESTPVLATLYTPSSKKVYRLTVYPDKSRQCVVMRNNQPTGMPSPLELLQGAKVKRTPAGTEVVEGHNTKVENVVVTRPDGKTITSKVWEAEDLKGVPVKIESQTEHGKIAAVYRDIVVAPQDKALFTPPDKCTPYEKMGQVVEDTIVK